MAHFGKSQSATILRAAWAKTRWTPFVRILINDFGGYAFISQLSRQLALRGHEVSHTYSPDVPLGKGDLELRESDAASLDFRALTLGRRFERYRPAQRLRDEFAYGGLLAAEIRRVRPHAVISANTPLFAQRAALRSAGAAGATFIYWLQDLLGVGVASQLRQRSQLAGALAERTFVRLEKMMLASSDHVVTISSDFLPILEDIGVDEGHRTVIENWAPLSETPETDRRNSWAVGHNLAGTFNYVYAGTLGLKHDPTHLIALAERLMGNGDSRIVVVSEGSGADFVDKQARSRQLTNVVSLPYQSYDKLPEVLGSADVLLALLEPSAGLFSVPSKILTYHCAARPILAAMPASNSAARLIRRIGSGHVTQPGDYDAFAAAAVQLRGMRPADRRMIGRRARLHAENAFNVKAIADRFESLLLSR